jgi:hypothetical protein
MGVEEASRTPEASADIVYKDLRKAPLIKCLHMTPTSRFGKAESVFLCSWDKSRRVL